MRIKTWKQIEKSDGYRRIKVYLRHFTGKEPRINLDIIMDTEVYSGWGVVPEMIKENDVLYSFGISDDIGFEKDIIRLKNVKVYAFDPTPYSVEWIKKQQLPHNFTFYPWAASGVDGNLFLYPKISNKGKKSEVMYTFQQHEETRQEGLKVDALTLESIAEKLGHEKIDILKMDIEGAEYDVLDSMLQSTFRPRILLVEFHHRFKGIGKQKTCDAVSALRDNGYLVSSISLTNREFCLVNRSVLDIKPTTLDSPMKKLGIQRNN